MVRHASFSNNHVYLCDDLIFVFGLAEFFKLYVFWKFYNAQIERDYDPSMYIVYFFYVDENVFVALDNTKM